MTLGQRTPAVRPKPALPSTRNEFTGVADHILSRRMAGPTLPTFRISTSAKAFSSGRRDLSLSWFMPRILVPGWPRTPRDARGRGHCCDLPSGGGASRRFDLCFHGIEVEARALLHRRILDRRFRKLSNFLLDEDESPELASIEIVHVPAAEIV